MRGDLHVFALALASLAIPGLTFRLDTGPLPQRKLAHVRAGQVAARDKWRLGFGNAPKRVGGLEAPDLRGIIPWADDHEVVVHNKPTRSAVSFGHPGLLGLGRVGKQ